MKEILDTFIKLKDLGLELLGLEFRRDLNNLVARRIGDMKSSTSHESHHTLADCLSCHTSERQKP
jgi:hypothetical protein